MLFESWFVLQAAEIAQQAATQIAVTAAAVQNEAHLFLNEITRAASDALEADISVNGACSQS